MIDESFEVRLARLEEHSEATDQMVSRLDADIRDTKELVADFRDKFEMQLTNMESKFEKKLDSMENKMDTAIDTSRRAVPGLAQAMIMVLTAAIASLITIVLRGHP